MLRELSFDDHADVAGTELLAPVFLAIAEENDEDTEIQGMRKKTLSIEDLCGVINEPGKLVNSHFSWTFLSKGERCMRLSLCKAPTQKEQHKGQPQHQETKRPTLFEQCVGSLTSHIELITWKVL